MRNFFLGFALCYAIAGISAGTNAYEIPATTKAGAVYAGAMWLPLNLLPFDIAKEMVPAWAFDFKEAKP